MIVGPNFQAFQFDPNQKDRCESFPGPSSEPSSHTLVRPEAVVSVWIRLNRCLVPVLYVLKGSDLWTSDRKLQRATQKKGNKLAGKGRDMKRLFSCFPERMKERRYNRAGEQRHLKIKKLADKQATKQVFF